MKEPYPTPPGAHRAPRRRGVVGPVILILAGALFLAHNLGLLAGVDWSAEWKLWPLVLVLVGLDLLLRDRLPRAVLAAASLVVLGAASIGILMLGPRTVDPSPAPASPLASVPLGNAKSANVTVRFGSGTVAVGALSGSPGGQLATVEYGGPSDNAPHVQYSDSGQQGQLTVVSAGARGPGVFIGGGSSASLNVALSPSVPLSLSLESGAANTTLDLRALHLQQLDVSMGAASGRLLLPTSNSGETISIKSGAASLDVLVPSDVDARIVERGGLSSVTIDASRFPQIGPGTYESPGFATSSNRVVLELASGLSSVSVH